MIRRRHPPIRSRPAATSGRNRPRSETDGRRRRQLRSTRILIIEDEPEERRALQLVLQTKQCEVRAAAGGDEALVMLDQFRPDLVVMDWRMPGLSGADLCRRIRARDDAPPIVVVSSAEEAFESAEDIAAALHKPVDLSELEAVIGSRLPSQPR